ncbi:GAF domain-containing protein, partial [Streptomyces carpinensis]
MPTVQADASPAQDAFRIARKLADAAVPAMADIVAVEISDAALEEHSAMSGVGAGGGFRRAAFRAVRDGSRGAYRIGEASRIPCGTPYRRSVIDQRPRVIAHVAPRTRWLARDPVRAPLLRESGVHSLLVVPLTAQHAVLGMAAFYRCGGSPPFGQADLRAAADLSQRVARMLDGVHRDLRGQAIGRMLQDALLPQPPEVTAIEEVQSHVPSDSVPGGWFDVIPLAGTRVGLAVGFADGRGITAAVAMSQQKSQIRALAALDFEPAEILTHALGPTHRETAPSAGQQHAGAGHRAKSHCLYAVYDPVTHRCAAA